MTCGIHDPDLCADCGTRHGVDMRSLNSACFKALCARVKELENLLERRLLQGSIDRAGELETERDLFALRMIDLERCALVTVEEFGPWVDDIWEEANEARNQAEEGEGCLTGAWQFRETALRKRGALADLKRAATIPNHSAIERARAAMRIVEADIEWEEVRQDGPGHTTMEAHQRRWEAAVEKRAQAIREYRALLSEEGTR